MKLLDAVKALFAPAVGIMIFLWLYPQLLPLHDDPRSIIGAEPAAWSGFFIQFLLLALGLLLRRDWAFLGAASSFAATCILLATAEGACKTGMLLFAGCSLPTIVAFALNVRRWQEEGGKAWPYLLTATLILPLVVIGGLLFGQ